MPTTVQCCASRSESLSPSSAARTLLGLALIVLSGTAFVVIPVGLSILATQIVWAKRYLQKAREVATHVKAMTKSAVQSSSR